MSSLHDMTAISPIALAVAAIVIIATMAYFFISSRRQEPSVLVEFSELAQKRAVDTICVDCTHPFLPNLTHHKVSGAC